jgi:hypothetical protein
MVNNTAQMFGAQAPERGAEINAQLQPQGVTESVGQFVPGAMLAGAAPGVLGAGLATAAETGSAKAGLAGAATAGVLGPVVGKVAALSTPALKWAYVKATSKLLSGNIAGAMRSGGLQAFQDLASRIGEDAMAKLARQARAKTTDQIARQLWKMLPSTVAHATGTEASYDSTDRSLSADTPAAIAEIAKKRRDAMQVLR